MTTPDQTPPDASPAGSNTGRATESTDGAWRAVARLLALQLATVVAVTAVITGIYVLADPHDDELTAGGAEPDTTTSAAASRTPTASTPPTTPAASPTASTSAPASESTGSGPSLRAHALKVDVLNQSGPKGSAARTAARVRDLGWKVGRVDNFRGTVTETTVYYPSGKAKPARELARELPGNLRVLPRFSSLSGTRLTVIITG
jgi:hypothetical protein